MLESILPWIGHFSFALMAASFLMERILWLRIFAIISGAAGIFYNSGIAMGWVGPANPELWNVVGWLTLFFIINIIQSIRLVMHGSEIQLTETERSLMSKTFPLMRSRDFRRLLEAGKAETLPQGKILILPGDHVNELTMVVNGSLLATDLNGFTDTLRSGQFVGDIGYSIGEQYGGSACTVVVNEKTEVLSWNYDDLRNFSKDQEVRAAIIDGLFRGLVRKKSLLIPTDQPHESEKEIQLPQDQRLINAATFNSLTSKEFSRLAVDAQIESFKSGDAISVGDRIGVIAEGTCRIYRSDGQYVDLGAGNLLGEVGFISRQDDKVRSEVVVLHDCRIYWWNRESIGKLAIQNPPVFARFMQDVARDMAVKMTRPLLSSQYHFPCRIPGRDDPALLPRVQLN